VTTVPTTRHDDAPSTTMSLVALLAMGTPCFRWVRA
jgi:hypothetical protein